MVSRKLNTDLTIQSGSHTPWYLLRGVEHKNLHMNVCSSFTFYACVCVYFFIEVQFATYSITCIAHPLKLATLLKIANLEATKMFGR